MKKIRYAVVGLGHIAQVAVLPAFKHAGNSELAALVTGDPAKLEALGRKYRVKTLCGYERYDDLLENGGIDAVYIALPNSMHADFAERAAKAGVHVLCEKPLAMTVSECRSMIGAARRGGVKLMTAYRLHFEKANLKAIDLVTRGKIGEPLFFSSSFGFQVREGNIRVDSKLGGGPLYDIGIYCVNAARYVFRDEPEEVFAFGSPESWDRRFRETTPTVGVQLRFPDGRLASFTCSFSSAALGWYEVVGTQGELRLEDSYSYAGKKTLRLIAANRARKQVFSAHDQFAPELIYFSDCILKDREPEPSGTEGLADVRVIEGIVRSMRVGRPVQLPPLEKRLRPTLKQAISRPPIREPEPFHAEDPTEEAA